MFEHATYIPATMTDHSAFFISVKLVNEQRGPGFWKFNSLLLKDPVYVGVMNTHLDMLHQKFGSYHPIEAWENIKMRSESLHKIIVEKEASDKKVAISQLFEKIAELEDQPLPPLRDPKPNFI